MNPLTRDLINSLSGRIDELEEQFRELSTAMLEATGTIDALTKLLEATAEQLKRIEARTDDHGLTS